ncbi:MAG: PHP domain-containing protein [Planctomycetota bacterium]|jgi:predicted metal-dependent phosphoesterase TrpH
MKPLNVADLHIHTTASDGACTAREVANLAHSAGLEIIAITDHDSIDGLENPRLDGLEIVPGVELSASFEGREVHILGYFIEVGNETLREMLKSLQQKRKARLFTILRKLAEENVEIRAADVFSSAGDGSISRLHVAEALIDGGHSANLYEAFRDYLGPEGAAFVPKPNLTVAEAVRIAHSAGGTAVLAHPGSNFSAEEIESFAAAGLDGIETCYPSHSLEETARHSALAEKLGLVITGGSDFHGRRYADTPIGAARVDRETVERLFERTGRNALRRLA